MKVKISKLLFLLMFISSCKKNETSDKNTNEINWGQCDKSTNSLRISCANITVPMNWNDENSKKINIRFMKITSKENNPNNQTLFFNPGGPGGSAIEIGKGLLETDFAKNYDIIAVNPRGYNEVKCNDDIFPSSIIANNKDQFEKIKKQSLEYIKSCYSLSGEIIDYIDTKHAAYDLEAVRKALNLKKINYLGVSYGTHLGATYAEIFPNSIDKLILDSVIDQTIPIEERLKFETLETKNIYNKFISWCKNSKKCALNSEPDIEQYINDFFSSDFYFIDKNIVTKEMLKIYVLNQLLNFSDLENLSLFLKNKNEIKNEKISINYSLVFLTNCLDRAKEEFTFEKYTNLKILSKNIFPNFAEIMSEFRLSFFCSNWNKTSSNEIKRYSINPNQKVLILNSEADARTPKGNAENLLNQIPFGRLLISKEPGHGVFNRPCIKEKVLNYLNNDILPNNYTLCEENANLIEKSYSY
ncbi:alpha/beta fold hydrolase [Pigmentibacter sp. JX0631]|uniref:alpha/beta fold hydrolase n=1 Tax=Pigmentibacter sp. JX0631 TaxID=2976982 RepID=UPI0024692064|nr:alpha/beta fold hydrolase [Pigmentibacter sp. JX0631]WGL60496.1 alpha/beta fold hydrolase [Pigmentibacter sp. JX0631]